MFLTQQGLHPVLQVSTKAEGLLRISCCATLVVSVLVTGLAAVLWEVIFYQTMHIARKCMHPPCTSPL